MWRPATSKLLAAKAWFEVKRCVCCLVQVLASLDENMQRYGDMLSKQQRSVAVSLQTLRTCHERSMILARVCCTAQFAPLVLLDSAVAACIRPLALPA